MMNFISYIMIGMVILACASDRMVFDAVIEEENASSETHQPSVNRSASDRLHALRSKSK